MSTNAPEHPPFVPPCDGEDNYFDAIDKIDQAIAITHMASRVERIYGNDSDMLAKAAAAAYELLYGARKLLNPKGQAYED